MATAKEWKEIFEKMVAFDEDQIEFYSKEIEREGKYLKQYRAEDRKHLEWIWGRGVLTRWEMECYGDKSYKGRETKDAEKRRNRAYRQRKYYRAKLEEHRNSLEEWEALAEEEAEREARRAEKEGAQEMKIKRNDYTSKEQFEQSGAKDEHNTVTVIRNDGGSYGKWMCIDLMTECKRPQTAVKRLFSVLTDDEIRGELNWRLEDVLELIENDCFALYEAGEFSFGCEENQEGLWYVWLNVCTEFPTEPKEEEPSLSTYPLTDLGEVLETLDENKTVIVYANGSANAPEVARYDGRNSIPTELNSARVHHYAQDINAYYVYLEEMPTEYEDEGIIVEPNNGSGYAHIGSTYDAMPKWNMTKDGAPTEGAHEFWQIRKLPQEPTANAVVLRQVATFSEAVEALKEIKREQDTRSELQRMCDDLAEELINVYDGKIIVEDEEGTTNIGTYEGLLEGDSVSMWDYFMGDAVLDVDYTINSRMEYKGVRLLVTFGGPNIYIDTNRGIVEGCWWADHAEAWIPSEVCATIDDVWAEYYSMMVG